jgi:hypothetical protein
VVSTAHWISWRCACSLRTAREYVRVARALRDLPRIREANSELVFRDPRGERLHNAPMPPPGSREELIARNRAAGLSLDDETLLTGDGERMDLELNVDAVARAIKGPRRDPIQIYS